MDTKSILYADDTAERRTFFARAAKRTGHNCIIVDDAARAWKLIEGGVHFDLIVSDHDMPKMKGLELLEKVRANDATQDTPFVLFTGNNDPALKSEAIKLGAVFVDKGNLDSLVDIITDNLPT